MAMAAAPNACSPRGVRRAIAWRGGAGQIEIPRAQLRFAVVPPVAVALVSCPMSGYPLDHFVADLEFVLTAAGSEEDVLEAVAPLAQKFAAEMARPAAADFAWHEKYGMGDLELFQAPDDGLLIVLGAWQPGHGVPPHDHGTWAVVVGIEGSERNTLWRRLDDGARPGHAEIDRLETKALGPGDVLTMDSAAIHSVENGADEISYTLHVYGQNLATSGRRQYDPEAQSVRFVAYDLA